MGTDGAQRHASDIRERAGHALQRPHRSDVGHADGETGAALRHAKALHRLLPRFVAEDAGIRRHCAGGAVGDLGPLLDQQVREILVGVEAMAQVAAVTEQRAQQRIGGCIALTRLGKGDEPSSLLLAAFSRQRSQQSASAASSAGRGGRAASLHSGARFMSDPGPSCAVALGAHGGRHSRQSAGWWGQVIGRNSSCLRSTPMESISTTS